MRKMFSEKQIEKMIEEKSSKLHLYSADIVGTDTAEKEFGISLFIISSSELSLGDSITPNDYIILTGYVSWDGLNGYLTCGQFFLDNDVVQFTGQDGEVYNFDASEWDFNSLTKVF